MTGPAEEQGCSTATDRSVWAVHAEGLRRSFDDGRIVAVAGVDLSVRRGEFVAICGPSGSGKSTLLHLIGALDRPDGGALRVCGCDLANMSARRTNEFRARRVGFVFQLHNLLPNLTSLENVQVPMLVSGQPARERADRAAELLERVGLAERMKHRPTTLSGGERQRVAVARALANSPELLLADEPTGSLDTATGGQILDLLMSMQKDSGATLIVVTHDDRVAGVARRVIHMLDGRVVAGP